MLFSDGLDDVRLIDCIHHPAALSRRFRLHVSRARGGRVTRDVAAPTSDAGLPGANLPAVHEGAVTPPDWDRLLQILQAPADERRDLAPSLVDAVGGKRLDEAIASLSQRIGPLRAITTTNGRPVLEGHHGRAAVWAHVDVAGEFDGLLLGPASTRRRNSSPGRGAGWRHRGPVLLWCLSFLLSVLWVWSASTVPDWIGSMGLLAAFLVLLALDLPCRALVPRWVRWIVGCVAAAAVGSAVHLPRLAPAGGGSGALVGAAALLTVGLMLAIDRRHLSPSVQVDLPVGGGRWHVAVGGARLANHHWSVPRQAGALDLIAERPSGARAFGLWPADVTAYAAYGRTIVSPCSGLVAAAVDGMPDQPVGAPIFGPPYGNHVLIRTTAFDLVLAHLQPGSVRVSVGQSVEAGDCIGRVGNSGRSTEPHLHLHAEHDGIGLGMRFNGVPGRPRRGRTLSPPSPWT